MRHAEARRRRYGLGERCNYFVYINSIYFTAERTKLCIEFIDQVANQAMQTWPFIIRFRIFRHGCPTAGSPDERG